MQIIFLSFCYKVIEPPIVEIGPLEHFELVFHHGGVLHHLIYAPDVFYVLLLIGELIALRTYFVVIV